MSRLENGKLVPRLVDVTALLDYYAEAQPDAVTRELRDRVLVLAAESRKQEWFSPFRDVMTGSLTADHIQRYVEFETDAEEILTYVVEFVPGLLQTAGYARAVVDMFYPDSTPRQRSRFVEFRLARQQVLRRRARPTQLRTAVRETALRRVLGSPAVMAEQLDRLASELNDGLGNVEIRIVPDRLAVPPALRGSFVVMRFPDSDGTAGLVYLEGRGGADYLQNQAVVARHRDDFRTLWENSLSQHDSLALLDEVRRSIT